MRNTSKNNQQVIVEKHIQHFTHTYIGLLVESLQRKLPTEWGNSFTICILNR